MKKNQLRKYTLAFIACLAACPLMGQLRQLSERDYALWGTLTAEQLSENGNWASYKMEYGNASDTLFLQHTGSMKSYNFPNTQGGQFLGEGYFAMPQKEHLLLFHLATGAEQRIPNVRQYGYVPELQLLLTLEGTATTQLVLRKAGKVKATIPDVLAYSQSPKGHTFCLTRQQGQAATLELLDARDNTRRIIRQGAEGETFKRMQWQSEGKAIAFYGEKATGETLLYCYRVDTQKLGILEASHPAFPKDRAITADPNVQLQLSADGERVFFGITSRWPQDTTAYAKGVAIWNAADKDFYPNRKLKASVAYPAHTAVWSPQQESVREITTDTLPWMALTGNQEFALLADPLAYAPFYKWFGDRDYYLCDLQTGNTQLLLQKQSGYDSQLSFSPDGRYIAYYRESDWHTYDLVAKVHTCITRGMDTNWDNRLADPGNELRVEGLAGWAADGRYLLVYDAHDIWKIATNGSSRKRLTNGKESGRIYRIDPAGRPLSQNRALDLRRDLILQVRELQQGRNGYALLTPKGKVRSLLEEDASLTRLRKAAKGNRIMYVQQRFDSPPALYVADLLKKDTKRLYQSNSHHEQYSWGTAKLIHYASSKGVPLQGALFYPAGYEPGRQYPMVVYLYEKLSHHLHRYVNPSLSNGLGFNIANLTAKGYAVLMPDIVYQAGNPGYSATDCVLAAVDEAIRLGVADPERLALIGHSFGGYETNFILTQTPRFAAAISGAAVADNVHHYFTYNTEYNSIDGWRHENQQYRMGTSFFEDREAYFRNNPLYHAAAIITPLLTWAGALDQNVQPRQAATLYAALRRLEREHIMLVYPDEGHIINKKENQADLTRKLEEWLDHYLRDKEKPSWMKPDREQQH
ncbi:S9 family peptidase [Flavobacterium soli]|uniref:S9 family peptidase n=1 Tax=Flavobacterium soli TaxID=344881 RepID=UPI00041363E2|nr:alpha/beta fold hydrolase [Flavobacterium soli]